MTLLLAVGCEKKDPSVLNRAKALEFARTLTLAGSRLNVVSPVAAAAFRGAYITSMTPRGPGIRRAAPTGEKYSLSCVVPDSPQFLALAQTYADDLQAGDRMAGVGLVVENKSVVDRKSLHDLWVGARGPDDITTLYICPPIPVPPAVAPPGTDPILPVLCPVTDELKATVGTTTNSIPTGSGCTASAMGGLTAGAWPPGTSGYPFPLPYLPPNCHTVGYMWNHVRPAGPDCTVCTLDGQPDGDCADHYVLIECICGSKRTCTAVFDGTHEGPNGEYCDAGCFSRGTKMLMGDKTQKAAEDVKSGDLLWNPALKRQIKVLKAVAGTDSVGTYEVRAGSKVLRVTAVHAVLSKRGVVLAKELRRGDIVFDQDYAPLTVTSSRRVYDAGDETFNFVLDTPSAKPTDRALVGNGIATGDYKTQTDIGSARFLQKLGAEKRVSTVKP